MTEQHEIIRLGHLGDGVTAEGVFVPRVLPTEVIEGDLVDGRIDAPRILRPSDDRVSAPCRHYKGCGGCALQHARDDFVSEWKLGVVQHALAAQGLETEFRPSHVSPAQSRRRAGFSVRRTKKGATAGFHRRASDAIVEVVDCKVLHPDLIAALPVAQAVADFAASRKHELTVQVTLSPVGLDVDLREGKPLDDELERQLAGQCAKLGLARLSYEGVTMGQRVPPYQQFGAARVVPPPGAFLQATQDGEAALLAAVREAVAGGKKGIDLFSGCGTFSLPLLDQAEMHGVEGERDMVTAMMEGWRAAGGLRKLTSESRDLFRNPLLAPELRADFAVIDPPRAGAQAQTSELAQSDIPKIAFVSCNPVTFARDAKLLVEGGYVLKWVKLVDQFRWSTHIELAAAFERV